ncbi:MAG TPA: molybdate ABC transporter substrate-binding protein [Xanthobacteraceae bacterium]|nr:molybdate ABC transporter substrate-binding protein [Xanthobacteraceae bacterium]
MGMMQRLWIGMLVASTMAFTAPSAPATAQDRNLLVFAAASLKNALDDVASGWQRQTGKAVRVSYAASNNLIRQIEEGAPADIFISADIDWMEYGQQKKLVKPETRSDLLGNRLVLIAPKDSPVSVSIQPGLDLTAALKGGRLSMANVAAVPAGKYGKAALEKLGAWERVKDRIAQAENVRAALVLVARGETPLGIVYETDAASEPAVKIVGKFPEDTHPPIIYPVAITTESTNPDAAAFLTFLHSPAARQAFERQGFTVLATGGKRS